MRQLKITNKITNRDSESITSYLNEIGKIPLLTEAEEIDLSQKSSQGDLKAREKIVNANLRFVVSVAKQYQNQGVLFEDLINEGNLGLIKAAERFDIKRGFKFISYAVWWIRQTIIESISINGRIVRLPQNQLTNLYRLGKETSNFEQINEREPTEIEIAEIMEEDVSKISILMSNKKRHTSLDAPMSSSGDSEDFNLYDIISVAEVNNVDEVMELESLKKDIEFTLNKLSTRHKEILAMYFGMCGYPVMTLEEIGEYFELTRERVRQIKETAIKLLRHRSKSALLRQHLK